MYYLNQCIRLMDLSIRNDLINKNYFQKNANFLSNLCMDNLFFKDFEKIEIFLISDYWNTKIDYLMISAHLLHKFVFCLPSNVNS